MYKTQDHRTRLFSRLGLMVVIAVTLCLSLWFGRVRVVGGQAGSPNSASEGLERFQGHHSGAPTDAQFYRSADQKTDRLPHFQRLTREKYLSGSHPLVEDPGLMINGRQHDKVLSLYDAATPPSALPTDLAKVICIATMTDSHGFVAEDRRSVYTEFTFSISTLYKSDDASLRVGGKITAARLGGRVHFPSGHIRDYITEGQGLPMLGHEYLLFLWRPDGSGDSYGITTAYEIQAGAVYALDPVKPFTEYEGMAISDFYATLAIVHRHSNQPSLEAGEVEHNRLH